MLPLPAAEQDKDGKAPPPPPPGGPPAAAGEKPPGPPPPLAGKPVSDLGSAQPGSIVHDAWWTSAVLAGPPLATAASSEDAPPASQRRSTPRSLAVGPLELAPSSKGAATSPPGPNAAGSPAFDRAGEHGVPRGAEPRRIRHVGAGRQGVLRAVQLTTNPDPNPDPNPNQVYSGLYNGNIQVWHMDAYVNLPSGSRPEYHTLSGNVISVDLPAISP